MKSVKYFYLTLAGAVMLMMFSGCTKSSSDTSGLYIPTSSDTTANATLQELEQGRTLYIDNCGACHSLFSPDAYTPTQWRSVMNNMAPKTTMSASEISLVTKYVTRGN
ncbi:MAG TPA: cytochrome c [Bacteroidales bacterium]|nr:cytochrome c [Bacteroidales bacterium]